MYVYDNDYKNKKMYIVIDVEVPLFKVRLVLCRKENKIYCMRKQLCI